MPPQGPGMIGALPRPAWGAVMNMLSSPVWWPNKARRGPVQELRRTCKALAELVGAACVGGAGWLEVVPARIAQLEAAPTAALGRALVVRAMLSGLAESQQGAAVAVLSLAVRHGHMIWFEAPLGLCLPGVARLLEAVLIQASREGQLLHANLYNGEPSGWTVDAMAQLSVVSLTDPGRETIATLVDAGTLQCSHLMSARWADMSILASLREVRLSCCPVEDLGPLADVPRLVVWQCTDIKALPAMRNDLLMVAWCSSLKDVSGLAGGHVGQLDLRCLDHIEDVSAIGAMERPPRTVILRRMSKVQDVSMLAGIHLLEVIKCPKLDKAATLEALEGKAGTIRWQ